MRKTIFLNKEIEVLVVSAGGVGTTFLMEEINRYKKTNCSSNTDGFKHLTIPPISFNQNLKVIYIFGDPIMACLSLFRREYQVTQSFWATKFQKLPFQILEKMTLKAYCETQKDGFYFDLHLKNWEEKYLCYPTLFLKYDNIFDSTQTIASFLDLPSSFVEQFPPKRKRLSSTEQLSKKMMEGLQKMYGAYQHKVNNYPSFFIGKNHSHKIWFNLMKRPYRLALKDTFLKKAPLIRQIKNKVLN